MKDINELFAEFLKQQGGIEANMFIQASTAFYAGASAMASIFGNENIEIVKSIKEVAAGCQALVSVINRK